MEEARDDSSMAAGYSQKQKGGYSAGTEKDRRKVHFCYIDGHLSSHECGVRVEISEVRGDIVKDDSGAYAVFTEQGSSASQMTAAAVMEVMARLPDCDGQAADAVSAYTQVKMKDAPAFAETTQVRVSRYMGTSSAKTTRVGETSRKDGCVVLRHGRTCSKMR